jgi:elongator complex protein 3
MKRTREAWRKAKKYSPEEKSIARLVLEEIQHGEPVMKAIHKYPLPEGGYIAKHALIAQYHELVKDGIYSFDPAFLVKIRMKPIRSLSGVTTVTVLTKPFPCPGECIFCPNDTELPKSYLREEPGAARAFENDFDPYLEVSSRLASYDAIGHPTSKIELLILGGSWTAYEEEYRAWFIQRCLDAMNGVESDSLKQAQELNETAAHRNVGLVIETRPDRIQPAELAWLRSLGVTKIQMGVQSLDEEILRLNRRGHTAVQALAATSLLRAAGYKTVLHWMPNLLGATPESDRIDFARLWQDYCPDEIKIYPTQLLETAELYQRWQNGEYQPYSMEELVSLVADVKPTVPEYCRINRIIRDIPSHHVVAGNKRTSLRQDAHEEMIRRGNVCRCIRCREVRGQQVEPGDLRLQDFTYDAAWAQEHFLQFVTPDDRIAGYLRLSLPDRSLNGRLNRLPADALAVQQDLMQAIPELEGAALIREVHVYGQSLGVGEEQSGAAQHRGLGRQLLEKAGEIARMNGFQRMAVISAIGTRLYYENRGFERGEFYQIRKI